MTESIAVADAGPLIHLDEVDQAAALGIFQAVPVSPEVMAEIQQRPTGPGNSALDYCHRRSATGSRPKPVGALSVADVASIQVAREHEAILLTDDLDLRDTAKLAGIQVIGTIGILVRAGRTGAITRDAAHLALDSLLAQSTLFITSKLIGQAKRALDS